MLLTELSTARIPDVYQQFAAVIGDCHWRNRIDQLKQEIRGNRFLAQHLESENALAKNESAVRELTDETLKKIAHELAENLRKNLSVDWSARESVQAKLRLMVKRILRKYKYPPDQQDAAVELVLQQAKALGEAWA